MTLLNKQKFGAWSMAQPKCDAVDFNNCTGCFLALFFRQVHGMEIFVTHDEYTCSASGWMWDKIPQWFREWARDWAGEKVSFDTAQMRWSILHPIDSQTIPITFPSPSSAVDVEVGL